jgi:uncharacterized LabA/DUF88 family protein
MKTVVYIDGQNFLYKAAEVLITSGKIEAKQDLHTFSFRTLIENLLSEKDIEIRFYGTKLKRLKSPPATEHIADKSSVMVDSQRQLRNCLNKQGIKFIESGKLKLRDGDVCKTCGSQEQHFQEKGVDVRIAVDMLLDAHEDEGQKFVLISSDTDLLPAIQNVIKKGKEVIYVGFSDKLTKAIVTNATETQIIRDAEIIDAFELLVSPEIEA